MKRLRLWCTVFFGWLFVFYNLERLHEPINLASFTYVLAAVLGLAIISWPALQRVALPWVLLAPTVLVLVLKWWLRYQIGGTHLPITITEICAVTLTVMLARQIGWSLEDFRTAVMHSMVSGLNDRSRPFAKGQGEIYREFRRARLYHRPLALLAIAPTDETVEISVDRFIGEIQRDTAHHYVTARIAEFLSAHTKACDIITRRNGHFVTVLPETDRDKARQFVENLEAAAKEQLGLELKAGLSIFPEEEITFVRLLERAEADMHSSANREAESPSNGNGQVPHVPAANGVTHAGGQVRTSPR